jgi:leader peptidase (prepilin peptidase)/N-methyltransferase
VVVVVVLATLFGSVIGSFLNVVVYRVPARRSIVSPPSACPHCGSPVRGYDNIPVVSWLVLRGKCRDCHAPISVRYPLVELGTALLFAAVALVFIPTFVPSAVSLIAPVGPEYSLAAGILVLAAFLYLASISIALSLIDLDTHTLPSRLVLPSYLVGVVLLGAAAVIDGRWGALATAFIGGGALFLLYAILAFVRPGGMGLGDVRLAGVLGLFLGWQGWESLVVGGFAAFVLGGVFGVVQLIRRRATRTSGIPFGPWMVLGAWLGIFAGQPIAGGYLALVGLR